MKVIVLGAGIIGVATAWYLLEEGHEVTVVDRQPDGRARDQLRQRRPDLGVLLRALGQRRRAVQGGQVDAAGRLAAAVPPAPRSAPVALGAELPGPVQRRRVRAQRGAAGRAGALQPRVAEVGRRAPPASSTTGWSAASCTSSRRPPTTNPASRPPALMRDHGVDRRVLGRDEVLQVEPALKAFGDRIHGGTYTPSDESGDARVFTQKLAERCAARGATFLYEHDVLGFDKAGLEDRGRASSATAPRCAARRCRRPRRRRRRLVHRAAAASAGHPAEHLSGQGLFGHAAPEAPGRRQRREPAGRHPQDRDLAPGRPHPHRRHRRDGRLRHAHRPRHLARALRGAGAPLRGAVPGRRRHQRRRTSGPACAPARRTTCPTSAAARSPTCGSTRATARWAGRTAPARAARWPS